jgi:hypothetical protein
MIDRTNTRAPGTNGRGVPLYPAPPPAPAGTGGNAPGEAGPPPGAAPGAGAARLLSVSERTLWGITAPRGPLPCVRIGRSVGYAVADLVAYVEHLREQGRQQGND